MILRPVAYQDKDAVIAIAEAAGIGMTSLPPHPDVLAEKIERAVKSFEGTLDDPGDELFFFVLEDTETGTIAGTCGIEAHIGLKRPMYSYKISTVTQHSDTLGLVNRNDMLQIVNDYTGVSEIGSLFLMPEYRRDRLGRFLSRVRFLFVGLFREHFDERLVAEIRGWHDGKGNSPFYDALAKKFFQIDFAKADWICATEGNRFISELMPTYPIYINLLPKEAQDVIGRPYVNSEPAKAMLEREGFHYHNYIDIFDGGPTLEARIQDVRAIKEMQERLIVATESASNLTTRAMLSNQSLSQYRACPGFVREEEGGVVIDAASAGKLGLVSGDTVVYTGA